MRKVLGWLIIIAVEFSSFIWTNGQGVVEQAPDGQSGTIKFGPPDLNDELYSSVFVPDIFKCDACRAIAYQIWSGFTKFNKKRQSYKLNLPESDVIDLIEEVCIGDDIWIDYGMKTTGGTQRLSGPGLEAADAPGVFASGGKWPARLRDMCENFAGEIGETTIYKVFHKSPTKLRALEDFLCRGPSGTLRGSCAPATRQRKREL